MSVGWTSLGRGKTKKGVVLRKVRAEASNIYDVQRRRDINGESQQPEPDQAWEKW